MGGAHDLAHRVDTEAERSLIEEWSVKDSYERWEEGHGDEINARLHDAAFS